MTELIKYPYTSLSKIEIKRVYEFKSFHQVDYNDIYVYYTTEGTLGVGYNIIVSLTPVKKTKTGYDFGETANNITDTDNLIDNF
jgi:hypothetical protein